MEDTFKVSTITEEQLRTCYNTNDESQIEYSIARIIEKVNRLNDLKSYQLEVLSPNQTIEIPLPSLAQKNIAIFSVSEQGKGNYFDLCIYTNQDDYKPLCYISKRNAPFSHSGDI